MSEMVERAARAIWDVTDDGTGEYEGLDVALSHDEARAALLAALDPEDEALVAYMGRWIKRFAPWGSIDSHQARDCAKRMLGEWRNTIAQGGTD